MDTVQLVKRLSKNYTDVISRDECTKHKALDWGNNGVGDRWCNKRFCYISIFANAKANEEAKTSNDEGNKVVNKPAIIEEFRNKYLKTPNVKKSGIIGIFVYYEITDEDRNKRPIREDIAKKVKSQPCVSCGSRSALVCDHKNDLYNDKRVLNKDTQVEDDFQCLCNHCNLQKRQVCITEKKNKKLYSAKNIPQHQVNDFDFPWEKKAYNENDKNLKEGTFWHDPVEFNRKVKLYSRVTIPIITEIKRKVQKNIITKAQ
jgi:hypothetical protein